MGLWKEKKKRGRNRELGAARFGAEKRKGREEKIAWGRERDRAGCSREREAVGS